VPLEVIGHLLGRASPLYFIDGAEAGHGLGVSGWS